MGAAAALASFSVLTQWAMLMLALVLLHDPLVVHPLRYERAAQSRRAVVALGYRNRYGFPHPRISARYSKRSIKTLSSSGSGAITVTLGREELELEEYRRTDRRYWHAADL